MPRVNALAKVSIDLIAIYIHSFQIFIIQIGEMAFCKLEFITMKSNYFQNVQKRECFLADFEKKNHPKSIRTSARTSISRTTIRSQNVILKVVSSKNKL
jgi:hypothetical protein